MFNHITLDIDSTEESLLIKSIQQESLEKCDNERLNDCCL